MVIGSLNRRIQVQTYAVVQDAGGGSFNNAVGNVSMWAKVENRTGSASAQEGQRQANYDYKITVRYYATNPIDTTMKIVYGTRKLSINSVQIVSEGRADFYILQCSQHGGN